MPKDHIIAQVVNDLRDTAVKFHGTQQLRERLRHCIEPLLAAAAPRVVADESKAVSWLCTDLDGHCDVGVTKEIAKQRAGHSCSHFIPLFDNAAMVQPVAVPDGWRAAIEGLMDFAPTNEGPLPGMTRGGNWLRKHDVIEALSGIAAPAAQGDAKEVPCYECDSGLVYSDGDTEPCRACEKGALLSLEAKAKEIYETWHAMPEYVAWKHGGNSRMQDRARDMARAAIAAKEAKK